MVKLTAEDFDILRQKAKDIKEKSDGMPGEFLGGKVRIHYCNMGLFVLHINESGDLTKVELPNGVLKSPPS